jgi:hypothetical protein
VLGPPNSFLDHGRVALVVEDADDDHDHIDAIDGRSDVTEECLH